MPILLDRTEHIVNIVPIAGTQPANRSYPINRAVPDMDRGSPKTKDRSMTLLLITLLVAFAAATGIVLADSGLRLWSAFGGIGTRQAMLRNGAGLPARRGQRAARVMTPVSYARPAAPRRAAA